MSFFKYWLTSINKQYVIVIFLFTGLFIKIAIPLIYRRFIKVCLQHSSFFTETMFTTSKTLSSFLVSCQTFLRWGTPYFSAPAIVVVTFQRCLPLAIAWRNILRFPGCSWHRRPAIRYKCLNLLRCGCFQWNLTPLGEYSPTTKSLCFDHSSVSLVFWEGKQERNGIFLAGLNREEESLKRQCPNLRQLSRVWFVF